MKIVLVVPPSPFLLDDRAFPFLGPLVIAAVARQAGHRVEVADLTGYKRRHGGAHADTADVLLEAKAALYAHRKADLIGFYSLAAQHPTVVQLNAFIRGESRAVTALGGPHANTCPERCLDDDFDYVVASDQGGGGGEPGFLELIKRVAVSRVRPENPADRILKISSRVPGVRWQNDRWPLPARDLIDLLSYRYFIGGERATSIVTATGCPFACTYCSHWEGYRKLEGKSSERVDQEIWQIRRDYGIRAFMFYDDEINLRPDFTSEFLPTLRRSDVRWRAFFKNGKHLTKEHIFEAMAASGCAELCTGAEAADPQILKAIRKGASVEDNTAFVRLCVKYGIRPKVFTQVGLPGETHETIEALRRWLIDMASEGLADADVSITTPYEGTPIFDKPEEHKIHFDPSELDYSKDAILYKGVPGEYKSHVWHDGLSREDIVLARQSIENDFRKAAGLEPLLAKDDG